MTTGEARSPFDWAGAYARLESARQSLEAGKSASPARVREVLEERARALARPLELPAAAAAVTLLVFSLGGERYGIEAAHVLEVVPLHGLTPVPSTPPFLLGVLNYRGRVLPVLDLRRVLAPSAGGVPEGGRVVVVLTDGTMFGIFADEVGGMAAVASGEMVTRPAALAREGQAFVRGVTGEMVAVLDAEALGRDPRIQVNDQAG